MLLLKEEKEASLLLTCVLLNHNGCLHECQPDRKHLPPLSGSPLRETEGEGARPLIEGPGVARVCGWTPNEGMSNNSQGSTVLLYQGLQQGRGRMKVVHVCNTNNKYRACKTRRRVVETVELSEWRHTSSAKKVEESPTAGSWSRQERVATSTPISYRASNSSEIILLSHHSIYIGAA